MYSTVNSVKEYTNVDVDMTLIKRAQALIESYTGRLEIEVERPQDLILLDKMTAYQAAYMIDNEDMIYKQIAVNSEGHFDTMVNFNEKMDSPWIAPLVVFTAKGLSWKHTRMVRTGKIFQWPRRRRIDFDYDWGVN